MIVSRKQGPFDKHVQLVQVDIRKDGADHSALRRTAQSGVIPPFFQIACFEQILYQTQEAVVGDMLAQNRQQDRMVNVVETAANISLDKPLRPGPVPLDFHQSRMTTTFWTEAMRMLGKLRLEVGFQKGADHFLQQFI